MNAQMNADHRVSEVPGETERLRTRWVAGGGAVLAAALLAAFHSLVAGAVLQGERFRTASLVDSERAAKCIVLAERVDRQSCLVAVTRTTTTVADATLRR